MPTENAAEVFYAKELGYFTKAGLDVDLQAIQSAPAIAAALASNAIDVGYTTVDTLAVVHSKDIPLVIVAPAGEYLYPATAKIAALLVPADSTVQQAHDLNGKIIAAAGLHGLGETSPRMWMDNNGGDSSTVKFVEVPFPSMPAALENHRVDAAFMTEPAITLSQKSARVLVYPWETIAKHFLVGAWIATPQWAKDHAPLVARFAGAIHDAAVWGNQNPGPSGAMLAKYTTIPPAVIATMARTHYAEQLVPAQIQPLVDLSAKYNAFRAFPAQELVFAPAK